MSIKANLESVKSKIRQAAQRAGRSEQDVRLLAVSKTKPAEALLEAYEAGVRDFGENYVQEILEKHPLLPEDARIHMIGHLQTNKAGKLIGKTVLIHSADSERLLSELQKQAEKQGLAELPVLLEVNIAKEESKFGLSAAEVLPLMIEAAERMPRIRIMGLMTSAPFTEDAETNRPYFAAMRKLMKEINEVIAEGSVPAFKSAGTKPLTELSMGMSGDYEAAVEEGATMVRVGTAIFGAREYRNR